VLALEWAYVPAVELIMHFYVIALPFITDNDRHRARRGKVAAVLAIRTLLFAGLAVLSLKAVLLYAVAWMIMLSVLRFADAYQHTYEAFAVLEDGGKLPEDKRRDRSYEQQNTYSNVVSERWPALKPAAAQLFLPQRPPREAGGALVSPAQAARRAVRQHLQPGHPDAQAARQLPPLPRTPRAGR
jgi:hypothetical protein